MSEEKPSRLAGQKCDPFSRPLHPPSPHRLPDKSSDTWTADSEAFLNAPPEPPPAAPFQPRPDLSEAFRHASWAPFRKRVQAALDTTPDISPRRRSAFACCGSDAYVECRYLGNHGHAEYRMRSTKCHDRFCVPCSRERSYRIKDALLSHMAGKKNLSLVTLTMRHSDAPLSDQLDRIAACFKRLRGRPLWKKAVKGGAAIIEVKVGETDGHWHVHYHIIAEANFLSQKLLSEEWLAVTGDSRIVDIRRVGAHSGAVQYITKYVTKAADHSIVMSPKHLGEAITGFQGRRLVATFGSWRGLKLMERPHDMQDQVTTNASGWAPVGRLDEIILAATRGEATALNIMRKLAPGRFRCGP